MPPRSKPVHPSSQKNRVVKGFKVDSVTDAPLQLIQHAFLKGSQKEVFDLVSDHEGMADLSFTISKITLDESKSETPCGKGTKRFCRTPVRFMLEEEIVCWQPPEMYGYKVLNCEMIIPAHLGLVVIEKLSDDTSLLIWRTYFRGRMVGGLFARTTLGVVLPDLVSNVAARFNGRLLSAAEAEEMPKPKSEETPQQTANLRPAPGTDATS